jgi:hypothetical protein
MSVSNSKQLKILAAAATGAVAGMGYVAQVHAAPALPPAIDVLINRSSDGNGPGLGTGTGPNQGFPATTYTPSMSIVPYAPSATYDAADTADAGTIWNTLLSPPSSLAKQTSGATNTVTFQTNLPLVDSTGASTGVKLAIEMTEPNNHSDGIHSSAVTGLGTGTDGLTANPKELMSQSWVSNSSSETIIFALTGLTPNAPYNVYAYGGGSNAGNGAAFSLPTANQGTGYGTGAGWQSTAALGGAAGAYTTVLPATATYHSVFSASGGSNPTPEQGLTWVLLPAVADANGDLLLFNQENVNGKGYVNGFQIQSAPEPASIGLLGAAALGLLSRRRREE